MIKDNLLISYINQPTREFCHTTHLQRSQMMRVRKKVGSPPTRERIPFSAALQKNYIDDSIELKHSYVLFLPTIVEPTTGYNPAKTSFLLNHEFILFSTSIIMGVRVIHIHQGVVESRKGWSFPRENGIAQRSTF